MGWDVEYTDEFGTWWNECSEGAQESIAVGVLLLERFGPHLAFPWSSGVTQSRHPHMRELRIQHRGKPYRILYAFDPRRTAVLLIGGVKIGAGRWYAEFVPIADAIYDNHLNMLRSEGTR